MRLSFLTVSFGSTALMPKKATVLPADVEKFRAAHDTP
jgi:hypothetical protein